MDIVRNEISGGTFNGPVIQAGSVQIVSRRPARSGYMHQVANHAAPVLLDREGELASMAAFATVPHLGPHDVTGAYWRWLAAPWAGKTALMAQFVLNPPSGVDVVSFFVTSRHARQNDRNAFCEVVHRQLYALLGEEEPPVSDYTRDEQLLLALDRAAQQCSARGRRLLLVVDGLDEDRGVLSGPDSLSIASLLPRVPAHGMRVLVAGRPHPPTPDDVPMGHALRSAAIDRWLNPSPHAEAVRREAEDGLLHLLNGGGLGRDLVGLVAASGGGLTVLDLADLASSRPRLVERELGSVSGRVFRSQSPFWASTSTSVPDTVIYLLAHEEIQQAALNLLTHAELSEYRKRLHNWADSYRESRWPERTPEYLLRGYTQLLRDQRDITRISALACDPHRHECLWQLTGSDLDALTEIASTFELHLACDDHQDVDVQRALILSIRRAELVACNNRFSDELIALWAQLGHARQAVGLACSRQDPVAALRALTGVVQMLAGKGRLEQAAEVVVEARELASTITISHWLGEAQGNVVLMMATAQMFDKATEVAEAIDDHSWRSRALIWTAEWLARSGDYSGAVSLARRDVYQAGALVPVIAAIADHGGEEYAYDLARTLEGDYRAIALASLAVTVSRSESGERALKLVNEALDSVREDWARDDVAMAFAHVGKVDRAVELARSLSEPDRRMMALASVAAVLAQAGDHVSARILAMESSGLADRVTADNLRYQGLVVAAQALVLIGETDTAVGLLEGVSNGHSPEEGLVALVAAMASAGRLNDALALAEEITDVRSRGEALAQIACVIADRGDHAQAEELARTASALTRTGSIDGIADLAVTLATVREPGLAASFAGRLVSPDSLAETLRLVVGEASAAGEFREAARIARTVADSEEQERALALAAGAATRAGELSLAAELIEEILAFEQAHEAQGFYPNDYRDRAVITLAEAFAEAGRSQEAIRVAHHGAGERTRTEALARVAAAMARAGEVEFAGLLAYSIAESAWPGPALAAVALPLSRAGLHSRALAVLCATPSLDGRAKAFEVLAKSLVQAGDHRVVAALEAPVKELADIVTIPQWQDQALARRVSKLVLDRRNQLAVALSGRIVDPVIRTAVMSAVAEAAGTAPGEKGPEDPEHVAVECAFLVERLTDSHEHDRKVSAVVGALAWTGAYERAMDLASGISPQYIRGDALTVIAEALAAGGEYDRAGEVAKTIGDRLQRDHALAAVIMLAASASQYQIAAGLAATVDAFDHQTWAFAIAAQAAVKERAYGDAEKIADAISAPAHKVRALGSLAAAAAQEGRSTLASNLTDKASGLARSEGQVASMASLAESWGSTAVGRRFAIEALSRGSWRDCLEAVRCTAPAALKPVAQQILSDDGVSDLAIAKKKIDRE
ncbi:hypothetical protein ACFWP2_15580 [Kitasatospora sp. NPDC058444]|uniref:hypothetical protein n=1 Tax=Kitasatospora sp. NPDC058444 TaxID=3346504 RepID=UPI003648E607